VTQIYGENMATKYEEEVMKYPAVTKYAIIEVLKKEGIKAWLDFGFDGFLTVFFPRNDVDRVIEVLRKYFPNLECFLIFLRKNAAYIWYRI